MYLIYRRPDTTSLAVLAPSAGLELDDLVARDIPAGSNYWIVPSLPDAPQESWDIDDSGPEPLVVVIRSRFVAAMIPHVTASIQARLDEFAATRGYDGILSACSYATSTIPRFASDGQRCVALRDATWTAGYAILAEVEAGNRPIPTVEQVMMELPALTWE